MTSDRNVCEVTIADGVTVVDSGRPLNITRLATRPHADHEQDTKRLLAWNILYLCFGWWNQNSVCIRNIKGPRLLDENEASHGAIHGFSEGLDVRQ